MGQLPDTKTLASTTSPQPARSPLRTRWFATLSLLGLGAAATLLGLSLLRNQPTNGLAKESEGDPPHDPAKPFAGWKQPDLALVLTGQSIGYLQPCGCSSPQYGGLARRYNFVQSLKAKGWPVVAVDLGDIAATHGPQAMIKYRTSMKALDLIGYSAIGLGRNEYLMPLGEALGNYSLNFPSPRVVASNLSNVEDKKIWNIHNVRPHEIVSIKDWSVGVLSIAGPRLIKEIAEKLPAGEKDIAFTSPAAAMTRALEDLRGQVNATVLLVGGDKHEAVELVDAAWKQFKAGKAPFVHAALYLDEDPPSVPDKIEGIPTQIITLGKKGKHVGVLGLFKKDKHTELRYQLVSIGPEFEPKEGDEKTNPVAALMQKYADELRDGNYLDKHKSLRSPHPTQVAVARATYVGSDKCAGCHEEEHQIWEKSYHSHALKTLVDAKLPSGRQYDPECIVCHTVGFQHRGGYFDPPAGEDLLKHNKKLQDVGCESCHGPGSEHVKNPRDLMVRELINPFRPSDREIDPKTAPAEQQALFKRRMNQIDWFCQKCHDMENDVHWGTVGFEAKWITRKIIHNAAGGRGDIAMKNAAARAAKEEKKK